MLDFNADLAEGCSHDAELMQYVTSVNIACATHAGSPAIMLHTLREAQRRHLRVGAHPGYWDREHFGRREQPIEADELYALILYQIGALRALADEAGVEVEYIKPHGAMYHQCGEDRRLANVLVEVAVQFELAVMGMPLSQVEIECLSRHVPYIREGFADRRYLAHGKLAPRHEPGSMITDAEVAASQIQHLVQTQNVQSICVHGDEPDAVKFIQEVQEKLAWR